MVTDLEQRRLAIADALRAIMAEPLPPRQEPIQPAPRVAVEEVALPAPVVDEPISIDLTEPTEPTTSREVRPADDDLEAEDLEDLEDLEDRFFITHEWDEELEDRSEVSVPPLEAAGTMSRIASLALFGHA
jgi:hypothetical protein